jgi:hypothetical protein
MFSLSDEQEVILGHVKEGENVIVDAVAGTGKTTMILSIAAVLSETRILQITYNSSLKDDVRKRATETNLSNIEIHTFHSLMRSYYLPDGYSDTDMRKLLSKDSTPNKPIPKFDMFVLDECQDMSFLYFQFIAKVIRDSGRAIQLIILGDYMQGLYDFKGADIRFLTMAEKIWDGFSYLRTKEFQKCTMKMSFRITNPMCTFVNDVMLGEPRMRACRDGQKVTYIRYPMFDAMKIVYGEIMKILDVGGKAGEIFVLAASVKGTNSNIARLENALVERGIPCHVPNMDGGKIDERVIDGKVVFSTFHASKGRQRKYVFIVGFDHMSMRYHTRNIPEQVCPNTLYVGATRATHGLYLLENDQRDTDQPLKFLKKSHIEMKQTDYIDFRGMHKTNFKDAPLNEQFKKITPTELIKFIPESIINELGLLVDKIFVNDGGNIEEFDIPSVIETEKGLFEEISDLNGIAIPAIYYDHLKQRMGFFEKSILIEVIDDYMSTMKENEHVYLRRIVKDIPDVLTNLEDYLYVANVSTAVQEKLYFKLKQIGRGEYTWLNKQIISKCLKRLEKILGKECDIVVPRIEETIISYNNDEQHEKMDHFLKTTAPELPKVRFAARVDLISKSYWELKCTKTLTTDHMLQVAIYAWLVRMRCVNQDEDSKKEFKLFNIRTGELLRLEASMDELNHIMLTLLKAKFKDQIIKTDEEFINDCRGYLISIRG